MTAMTPSVLQGLIARAAHRQPTSLYKFRGASDDDNIAKLRTLLVDKRIWFATPLTFNDPFDCFPAAVISGNFETRRRALLASFNRSGAGSSRNERRRRAREVAAMKDSEDLDDLLEAGLRQTLLESCVLSLSEKWDDLLMWSHYAKAHEGVCIELGRREPESIVTTSLPVHYAEERPVIDVLFDRNDDKIVKALYTKSRVWNYEAEWRAVLHAPQGLKKLPDGVIQRVILGAAMRPERRQQVRDMCATVGVPCSQAAFHRRRWQLELQDPRLHD